MTIHVVTDVKLEVEATLDTPATVITAVTNANPGVATATGHSFVDGDIIVLSVPNGMVELNAQVCRVANVVADEFELEGIDTTDMSAWVEGDATSVATWSTLCQATGLSLGNAAPTELDASNFCSKKTITLYGLAGAISGSIDVQHDAQLAAIQTLKAAKTDQLVAFRYTRQNGSTAVFGAVVSFSGGFDATLNSIETATVAMTVPNEIVEYPAP